MPKASPDLQIWICTKCVQKLLLLVPVCVCCPCCAILVMGIPLSILHAWWECGAASALFSWEMTIIPNSLLWETWIMAMFSFNLTNKA